MRVTKKRISTFALAMSLALLTLSFALAGCSPAPAWDDCPKGLVNDPYPGACRRYVDANGDGICDLSQPEPVEATTTTAEVVKEDPAATTITAVAAAASGEPPTGDCPLGPCANCGACLGIDSTMSASALLAEGVVDDVGQDAAEAVAAGTAAVTAADVANTTSTTIPPGGSSGITVGETADGSAGSEGGSIRSSLFTHYNVSPIAIAFFLVYAVSFVLHKTKRIRLAMHRKVWNVLLAATFLVTGIFGLILTIKLDYELPFAVPFDLLFWHVEAGVTMTLISLFHLGWHFNYYRNVFRRSRKTMREARDAERKTRDVQDRPEPNMEGSGGLWGVGGRHARSRNVAVWEQGHRIPDGHVDGSPVAAKAMTSSSGVRMPDRKTSAVASVEGSSSWHPR